MSMYLLQKAVINDMDKVRRLSSGKGVVSINKIPVSEIDKGLC